MLIMNNLEASRFSILLNGRPEGFFQSSRGLKQGDPLSPFLFIIFTEAFSRGIKALYAAGSIAAYAVPRNSLHVSHLAFADDLVIFTRGLRSSLRVLMDFLGDYEQATGQKVNKNKSLFIASSRCSSSQVRAWSTLTGMRYGSLPLLGWSFLCRSQEEALFPIRGGQG